MCQLPGTVGCFLCVHEMELLQNCSPKSGHKIDTSEQISYDAIEMLHFSWAIKLVAGVSLGADDCPLGRGRPIWSVVSFGWARRHYLAIL